MKALSLFQTMKSARLSLFPLSLSLLSVFVSCGDASGAASMPSDKAGTLRASADAAIAPWQKETLDAHNAARAKEGANLPALTWNSGLAAFAQTWADSVKKKRCEPAHRPPNARTFKGKLVGENIYWQSLNGLTPSETSTNSFFANGIKVTNAWAGEKPSWSFSTKRCAPGAICGHYTQLVWKTTTTVGCGRAACGATEVWVCNYQEAGNFVDENPY